MKYDDSGTLAKLPMPRQASGEQRCLADLVPPIGSGKTDHVGLFVTTCQGKHESVRALADTLKAEGPYVRVPALQALAIETAEAAAAWLHQELRTMWGIADPVTTSMQDLFSARYHGKRYSFGYPACPRLDDQAI
jgi:5-methyltetrahydrofolate--homocysteine methyltransferase